MTKWNMVSVECHECGVSTAEVQTQVKPLQVRNERILTMFKAVGLVTKPGKYYKIDKIYGKGNDKAFKVFWNRASIKVKSGLQGYVPKEIYKQMVSDECQTRMAAANKVLSEYFDNVNAITAAWNTRVIDEANENADRELVCSHCGSSNVKVHDTFKHYHTGISISDLKQENYEYGFKDQEYDDVEVYEDYSDYTKEIKKHELEEYFYDFLCHYPIHIAIKKLNKKFGYGSYMYIVDAVSDYYGAIL